MRHKILIVDDLHEIFMSGLRDDAIDFDYFPNIKRPEILEIIAGYSGLVIRTKTLVDKELLDAAVSLRFVARAGAGMDNIDEAYATGRGVLCFNAPEGNRDAVAEQTIGIMLSLTRKIFSSFEEVKAGKWDREGNRGDELTDMTIAIIGYGNTGSAVAQKLSAFGCRVIFYDKKVNHITTTWAREALMTDVYEQADVVSFHIPLNDENAEIINKELIYAFKKPIYLLNLSRGGIMKTGDILEGLRSGKIKGVGLDVLENEKLDALSPEQEQHVKELLSFKNVIITPHVGGWTFSSYRKISEVLLTKFRKMWIESKI